MSKAYLMVLRVVALVVAFVLGMLTSVAGIVGAGVFATTAVTLDKLENYGINIDISELFDDSMAQTPVRSLTILEIYKEINKVASIADVATFDYLSKEYGLVIPTVGDSPLFDSMRSIPFAKLFSEEGLNEAMAKIYIGRS